MKRYFHLTVGALAAIAIASAPARAAIIHESATLGPTGSGYPAIGLGVGVYAVGSRFSIDHPVEVESVGGHLFGGPGPFAAAIVQLISPTGMPAWTPLATPETALASTLFTPPLLGDDVLVPLSVILPPGHYALVFSADLFGATGSGGMPFNNTNIPGAASYFIWTIFRNAWYDIPEENLRFVVTGRVIPEPGAYLLAGIGAWLLLQRRVRRATFQVESVRCFRRAH